MIAPGEFRKSAAGIFTSSDVGNGADVEGEVTANTVGQLTIGRLTVPDTGAVVEGAVEGEAVVEVEDVVGGDRRATWGLPLQLAKRTASIIEPRPSATWFRTAGVSHGAGARA